jgi:hypothetical protein
MTRVLETFRSKHDGQWYFRLVADNGELVAHGEGYHNRGDMYQTIDTYFPEWERKDVSDEEGGES